MLKTGRGSGDSKEKEKGRCRQGGRRNSKGNEDVGEGEGGLRAKEDRDLARKKNLNKERYNWEILKCYNELYPYNITLVEVNLHWFNTIFHHPYCSIKNTHKMTSEKKVRIFLT